MNHVILLFCIKTEKMHKADVFIPPILYRIYNVYVRLSTVMVPHSTNSSHTRDLHFAVVPLKATRELFSWRTEETLTCPGDKDLTASQLPGTGRWLAHYSNDPVLPWWPYTWPIEASGSATAIHLIVPLTNLIVCLMWLEEPSLYQMCHRLSKRKWVKRTFEMDWPYLSMSHEKLVPAEWCFFTTLGIWRV